MSGSSRPDNQHNHSHDKNLPNKNDLDEPLSPQSHAFWRRLEQGHGTVQAWDEAVETMRRIRHELPWHELVTNEDDSSPYDDLSRDAPLRRQFAASQPYQLSSIVLLQRLARYFQRHVMTWVNTPQTCANPECRTNTTTTTTTSTSSSSTMVSQGVRPAETAEELAGHASRVEVYLCTACLSTTTFPRYNAVSKLFETRQGRCGEYANLFGLYCRAVGFDTRYVVDWTDHVWTEVVLLDDGNDASSVIMIDSCEGVVQEPSMYEVGWGKDLSCMVAFHAHYVVDVTARYTRKFTTLSFPERRRQATHTTSEVELEQILFQFNQSLWEERRKTTTTNHNHKLFPPVVSRRVQHEQEALERLKSGTDWNDHHLYQLGRLSGSTDWKRARHELGSSSSHGNSPPTTTIQAHQNHHHENNRRMPLPLSWYFHCGTTSSSTRAISPDISTATTAASSSTTTIVLGLHPEATNPQDTIQILETILDENNSNNDNYNVLSRCSVSPFPLLWRTTTMTTDHDDDDQYLSVVVFVVDKDGSGGLTLWQSQWFTQINDLAHYITTLPSLAIVAMVGQLAAPLPSTTTTTTTTSSNPFLWYQRLGGFPPDVSSLLYPNLGDHKTDDEPAAQEEPPEWGTAAASQDKPQDEQKNEITKTHHFLYLGQVDAHPSWTVCARAPDYPKGYAVRFDREAATAAALSTKSSTNHHDPRDSLPKDTQPKNNKNKNVGVVCNGDICRMVDPDEKAKDENKAVKNTNTNATGTETAITTNSSSCCSCSCCLVEYAKTRPVGNIIGRLPDSILSLEQQQQATLPQKQAAFWQFWQLQQQQQQPEHCAAPRIGGFTTTTTSSPSGSPIYLLGASSFSTLQQPPPSSHDDQSLTTGANQGSNGKNDNNDDKDKNAWTTCLVLPKLLVPPNHRVSESILSTPLPKQHDTETQENLKSKNGTYQDKAPPSPPSFQIPVDWDFFKSSLGNELLVRNHSSATTTTTTTTTTWLLPTEIGLENCRLVGLYFSAHWCPPCRSFTPMLAQVYQIWKEQQQQQQQQHGLEIVFVSSDRDESSFQHYHSTMPWPAIPFHALGRYKAALSHRYGVQGIPSLVILDAISGQVVVPSNVSRNEIVSVARSNNTHAVAMTLLQQWMHERVPASTLELLQLLEASCHEHSAATPPPPPPTTTTESALAVEDGSKATTEPNTKPVATTPIEPNPEEDASPYYNRNNRMNSESPVTPVQLPLPKGPHDSLFHPVSTRFLSPPPTTRADTRTTNDALEHKKKEEADPIWQCIEPSARKPLLDTLIKYVNNCRRSPWVLKYRRFRASHSLVDRHMTRHLFALAWLQSPSVGLQVVFQDDDNNDDYYIRFPVTLDLDALHDHLTALLLREQVVADSEAAATTA